MTANPVPTRDEILKVRRWQCVLQGHSWRVIESLGRGPQMIVCTNCGARHLIEDSRTIPTEDEILGRAVQRYIERGGPGDIRDASVQFIDAVPLEPDEMVLLQRLAHEALADLILDGRGE